MIKKCVLFTALLMIIDQGAKHIIFQLYMNKSFTLVPNILLFRTVQNKHLSYLGSLLNTKIPLAVMVLVEVIGIVTIIMLYRYCMYVFEKHGGLLKAFLYFGLAGVLCGFIDNVFWGGSIDFIQLFDWFIFDLKDVYLTTMSALIVLYGLYYTPVYNKLSKECKKKTSLILWIKNGCPAKPI